MRFAPTWLRQVEPPASHGHFNHFIILPPVVFDDAQLCQISTHVSKFGILLLRDIVSAHAYRSQHVNLFLSCMVRSSIDVAAVSLAASMRYPSSQITFDSP